MSEHSPITPAIRHDGWTPERRIKFLDHLASRGNVRAACAHAGMSAEAAYRLRRREAAFARAWAAALGLAREAGGDELATRAIDGIEEDVWYRGELVGTRRKYDSRLLLAHLARLDKLVEEQGALDGVTRFDELLACIAGAEVPEELASEGDALPIDRQTFLERAGAQAVDTVDRAWAECDAEEEADEYLDGEKGEERYAAYASDVDGATALAGAEAAARWDAWFAGACETVDAAVGRRDAEPPSPSADAPTQPPAAPADATAEEAPQRAPESAGRPNVSDPGTVSEVSSSPRPGTYEWHLAQRAAREGKPSGEREAGCDAASKLC